VHRDGFRVVVDRDVDLATQGELEAEARASTSSEAVANEFIVRQAQYGISSHAHTPTLWV
jgi:hypothetical protein